MSNELKSCPFCGETDWLRVVSVGSLTADMPSRPYAVVCRHLDCELVHGPVAYGQVASVAAWNTRPAEASLTIRAAALADDNERLKEALRPFAQFAEWNTDNEGWAGTQCQRERIVDWFGPTDFRRARAALEGK